MLVSDWTQHKPAYDVVVVGSGYGGAVVAARLATADLPRQLSLCVLERGREWPVGSFPDSLAEVTRQNRSPLNPLGLFDMVHFRDLSVLKGNGVGGGSLINANVAMIPEERAFGDDAWPRGLTRETLLPYYARALRTLGAAPHPRAGDLRKYQALDRAARGVGGRAVPADIAVNFTLDGVNEFGVAQTPCVDCGDCTTGCNYGAKNTLAMNYLPLARRGGAEIYERAEVEWVERLLDGGWRVHGIRHREQGGTEAFQIDARDVVLAAGALNTTEILMRSEARGLRVSPRLGTGFSGNGDFYAIAYNGDVEVGALGVGRRAGEPGQAARPAPGPAVVGTILKDDYLVQEGLVPSAYVRAAQAAFTAFRGEDTDAGDEAGERGRVRHDLLLQDPYAADSALWHTLSLLATSTDDARGSIAFDAPWFDRKGRIAVIWDEVGRQAQFARLNADLRRMARSLGATFVESAFWTAFDLRRLVSFHPLGGCPAGDDDRHGAADEFGRVFAADGGVHEGLFVADGALIPAALRANPFLTIAAIAERIAERKIRHLQGEAYPAPAAASGGAAPDSSGLVGQRDAVIERAFRRAPHLGIDGLVNGGAFRFDIPRRRIFNDVNWKGFLPRGLPLGELAARLFTGYYKRFWKEGGRFLGETRYLDGRVPLGHTLEEIVVTARQGDLDPGTYVLLRYTDPPFDRLYYDIMKLASADVLLYRGYTGIYPHGVRGWTAPLLRGYGFGEMSALDHERLFEAGAAPAAGDLEGTWRMDAVANANHLQALASVRFETTADGRLEARCRLAGPAARLAIPPFLASHFQADDFAASMDEMRALDRNCLVGKWVTTLPGPVADRIASGSLGLLHVWDREDGQKHLGYRYLLTRTDAADPPSDDLLEPYLTASLPPGVGVVLDEEMVGTLQARTGGEARAACEVHLQMDVPDLATFLHDERHEARLAGRIRFSDWQGTPQVFAIDRAASRFHHLPAAGPEGGGLSYHLEFEDASGRRYLLEARAPGRDDALPAGPGALEATVFRADGASRVEVLGGALTLRTAGRIAGSSSLPEITGSFHVTGTADAEVRSRARLAFLAVLLRAIPEGHAAGAAPLHAHVRESVATGASSPDFFSTRPTPELQEILRDAPGRPLRALLNSGQVRIDFAQRRIHRDVFWKGSFAKDTLLGWEERVRTAALGGSAERLGAAFAGGAFWKRFDAIEGDAAVGHVVNYELHMLPGRPEVREVVYPDDRRKYFRKDDRILLLRYRNHPYRIVYDTIKVIDDENAIGVMHLGEFPNGVEFATFVMARNNYPFEKMTVPDHDLLFRHPETRTPAADEVEGAWTATLVVARQPERSLWNAANPDLSPLQLRAAGDRVEVVAGFGDDAPARRYPVEHFRRIDDRTLLGRLDVHGLSLSLYDRLRGFLAGGRMGLECRLVLTRPPL